MIKFNNMDFKKSVIVQGMLLIVILFLLNGISRNYFFRWDLTDNDMYSLSPSSESVVEQVDDLLTMKVYFSDDLPGEYANNRRYLQDILEEYAAYSGGNIHFEFHRPNDDEKIQEDAQKSGIQPVQLQVIENDNLEIKRVYMGMVFLYEDERETIPVIQTTTGLEYDITTKIKKMVDSDKKTLGIVSFGGEQEISNCSGSGCMEGLAVAADWTSRNRTVHTFAGFTGIAGWIIRSFRRPG